MQLQAISSTYAGKVQTFGNESYRNENLEKPVTLKDLRDMENRINLKNKELVKMQNKLLGESLSQIMWAIWLNTKGSFDRALESARKLRDSDI